MVVADSVEELGQDGVQTRVRETTVEREVMRPHSSLPTHKQQQISKQVSTAIFTVRLGHLLVSRQHLLNTCNRLKYI